jgi:hypothetical protein
MNWYNELTDSLDVDAPDFPKKVLKKIKSFEPDTIEYIDRDKTILVKEK